MALLDINAPFKSLAVLFVGLLLFRITQWAYRVRSSPLLRLRGPPTIASVVGHFRTVIEPDQIDTLRGWVEQYGDSFKVQGPFGFPTLLTLDQKAAQFIHAHPNIFHKPLSAKKRLRLIADGIIFVEGSQHAQQRRIMNPTFGAAQIRELIPLFFSKALKMRDVLLEQITIDEKELAEHTADHGNNDTDEHGETQYTEENEEENGEPEKPVRKRYNITSWLSRVTLDVIGLAGFNYDFESLSARESGKKNELSEALSIVLTASNRQNVLKLFLTSQFPLLRLILRSKRDRDVENALATMTRIGMQLINEKKRAVLEGTDAGAGTDVKADDVQGKDLLSLMVKANMASDLPEEKRMSDRDVLFQVPTFILAGHETSATATTWTLFALSKHPAIQSRLRAELLSIGPDEPPTDTLDRLPFLDAVVHESLRLHAPVPAISRYATEAIVVPLDKPYVGKDGVERMEVRMEKGDDVVLPLLLVNRDKRVWGEDADEFNPNRWNNLPEKVKDIVGVWGNMSTFGAGIRGCIGFRFALLEVKVLLFTLIRAFEFELAFPLEDLRTSGMVVQRPYLASEAERGNQMPLYVRAYKGEA